VTLFIVQDLIVTSVDVHAVQNDEVYDNSSNEKTDIEKVRNKETCASSLK